MSGYGLGHRSSLKGNLDWSSLMASLCAWLCMLKIHLRWVDARVAPPMDMWTLLFMLLQVLLSSSCPWQVLV